MLWSVQFNKYYRVFVKISYERKKEIVRFPFHTTFDWLKDLKNCFAKNKIKDCKLYMGLQNIKIQ